MSNSANSQPPDISQLDAIVLAGGDSRRMGQAKANLPFGDTSLVGTAVAVLKPVFRNVLVVTRDKNQLPDLDVEVLEDQHSLQGPLVGVARGLAHSEASWCFVAACDMPFLKIEVIKEMVPRLRDCDAVIPQHNGRLQTLHAFYSRNCLTIAEEILGDGITSMRELASRCRVTELPEEGFRNHGNGLTSFRAVDTTE
ncbi:MAG: molybdenum cofactor guanylyltransferase, partial [Chloroflexi bacterium]|nr:molybdenum cofactor guanylyltransferase [Chloroflexota bacterium]